MRFDTKPMREVALEAERVTSDVMNMRLHEAAGVGLVSRSDGRTRAENP